MLRSNFLSQYEDIGGLRLYDLSILSQDYRTSQYCLERLGISIGVINYIIYDTYGDP